MRFIARRLAYSVALVIGVSFLSFLFLQLAPGNFFDEMRLNPQISTQTVNQLYRQSGMDRPMVARYLYWLKSAAKGDLGISFAYNAPVAPMLVARSRNTLLLTGTATVLSWVVVLPIGVISAATRRRRPWLDHTANLTSTILLVIPDLLLALGVLWLAVRTHWIPVGGMLSQGSEGAAWAQFKDLAVHLIAPVSVLVVGGSPILFRHVRAAMLEVLDAPYIRAAQAHGISTSRILFRHALPAAAAPLVSLFGLSLGSLLSVSLLVEVVMNWPGLGPLLLESILARDVYVVIGAVMFSAIFLIAGMLVTDLLLFAVDPRIRTEGMA
jgi:peptide/nickel transport system permease protein